MVRNMAFKYVATVVYVRVDAWCQNHAAGDRQGRSQAPLGDSEVITPLPVVGYKRSKDRNDFAATSDYGVCASRNRLRERIEGAFHEVRNTGRHLEHPTCRTLRGPGHAWRGQDVQSCPRLLLRRAGIAIRTFTVAG